MLCCSTKEEQCAREQPQRTRHRNRCEAADGHFILAAEQPAHRAAHADRVIASREVAGEEVTIVVRVIIEGDRSAVVRSRQSVNTKERYEISSVDDDCCEQIFSQRERHVIVNGSARTGIEHRATSRFTSRYGAQIDGGR